MNRTTVAIAAAASGAAIAPAHAGVFDLFDDRAAWLAAVDGPVATEGFEGRDALGPIGSPSVFSSGLGVAHLGDADVLASVQDIATTPDQYMQNTTPGGSQFVWFGVAQSIPGEYTQQYLLPNDTNAFAFDIIDWEPGLIASGPQGAGLELYNDGGLVFSAILPSDQQQSGLVTFIGFTSDVFIFDEVRFTVREAFFGWPFLDVTGVDEVAWVIPAPGGAAIFAFGALATCRRRR
ncbi:MAG: hypothetical protein Tsb0013_02020 [Phycisphaerales bacterium]